MKKLFKEVENINGEVYSVYLTHEDNTLFDFSCTCRYMSFDFWSKRFQKLKTLCRHILKVCAENNLELPEKYKTERNLKIMEKYK